jgi:DnaK suppressor protein
MLNQDFIEKMKTRLLEEKETLLKDLAGLQSHTEVGNELDENATEVQIDDLNKDLIARMSDDLDKIEKALQKIADGTYGVDDDGNEISEARLEAIPWADKAL